MSTAASVIMLSSTCQVRGVGAGRWQPLVRRWSTAPWPCRSGQPFGGQAPPPPVPPPSRRTAIVTAWGVSSVPLSRKASLCFARISP